MKPKPKPRRRRDATPLAVIAAALTAADRESDEAAAKRFGVPRAKIKAWRARAATDPELEEQLREVRRRALDEWRFEAAETAIEIAREIRRRLREQEEIPFALIAAAKTYGATCVEAGALLEPPAGPPEAGGEEGAKG